MTRDASTAESPEVARSKQRIAESTLLELQQHGMLGLRLADVAERAGVSVPLIHKYFGDRDGLLATVIADEVERNYMLDIEAMSLIGDNVPDEALFDTLLGLMPKPDDQWRRERRWFRLEAKAASQSLPVLRERLQEGITRIEASTELLIERVRARTGNSSTVSAKTVAWMLLALSDGFTNLDLNTDRIHDEQFLPLVRDILLRHVF